MRSLSETSTLIHCSSVSVGQTWCGCVMTERSGLRIILALSVATCSARKMRMRREKAVYEEMDVSQSS